MEGEERRAGGSVNLVVIMSDQLRASSLGCYGSRWTETPNIDRLARDGVLFSRAFIEWPTSFPARCCVVTGRHVKTHRAGHNYPGSYLPESEITLAEVLSEHGYATGYVSSWAGVAPETGLGQGFQFYDEELRGVSTKMRSYFKGERGVGGIAYGVTEVPEEKYQTALETRSAVNWVRQHSSERFFLWLDYRDPHPFFAPPHPYDEKYDWRDVPLPPRPPDEFRGKPERQERARRSRGFDKMGDSDIQKAVAHYEGEVALVDKYTGLFMEELEGLGLRDRTLVVFLSDHGTFNGEHGLLGKGTIYLYEPLVHIPLILACPGRLPAGRVVDGLVEGIDIMPTVLELLGLPRPGGVQGVSFLPLAEGRAERTRAEVYLEHGSPRDPLRGIRTEKWKYVYSPNGGCELYDLERDPYELSNLVDEEEDTVRDMQRRLLDWEIKTDDLFLPLTKLRRGRRALSDYEE